MLNFLKTSLVYGINLLCLSFSLHSLSSDSMEEQTVIAALTMNIVRFTTWPEGAVDNTINLCVLGDNVMADAFDGLNNKTVENRSLQIVKLSRLRNIENCQVLYISDQKQINLLQLFNEIKNKPFLTIGESIEFAEQGGMIGLENDNGKMNLHINLPVVKAANLNISSRLLSLAKIIGN